MALPLAIAHVGSARPEDALSQLGTWRGMVILATARPHDRDDVRIQHHQSRRPGHSTL